MIDDASGRVNAPALGDQIDFCSEERFEDQPSAAFCTGVLVDRDLVLTAGHCARYLARPDMRAVFDFYYRAPGELATEPTSVYGVKEVVAERLDPAGEDERIDYAWFRLSRAVEASREPLPLALGMPETGTPFAVASASYGLPLKVDESPTIRDARPATEDFFLAAPDTSRGASGSPAIDGRGAVLGVLARGGSDDTVTMEGCVQTRHEPSSDSAQEQFTYSARALDGLCDADASSSLCRRSVDRGELRLFPDHDGGGVPSLARAPGHGRHGIGVRRAKAHR
jgi:hypothetical protein